MFNLYQEPPVIAYIIAVFSLLTTLFIWLIPGFIYQNITYISKNKLIDTNKVLGFAIFITFINWLGLTLNFYVISVVYLYLVYLSAKKIEQKSLKWINISMLLFMYFIIGTYAFFNYKIHYITYVFFSSNDIVNYQFDFKPYFKVYHIGDFLGSVSFNINNHTVTYTNEPIQYRIYMFYYFLHFIGLSVWLFIYFDVLKKHKFSYDKPYSYKKETTLNKVDKKSPSMDYDMTDLISNTVPIDHSHDNNDKAIKSHMNNEISHNLPKNIPFNAENLTVPEAIISKNIALPLANEDIISDDTSNTFITKGKNNMTTFVELLTQQLSITEKNHMQLREDLLIIKEKEFELKTLKYDLEHHSVFKAIKNTEHLQYFMTQHVYAVWDFMSLLKRLQKEICCVEVPWISPIHGNASRLINEIVLGEESDKLPNGNYMSHFDLYLLAMQDVQANIQPVTEFIHSVKSKGFNSSIDMIPEPARTFVKHTMSIAMKGSLAANLGSFFNARENVIPSMFTALLNDWHINESLAPMFHYYLVRHIQLDGDEHGPAGDKLMSLVIGEDRTQYIDLLDNSISSIKSRIELWDGVLQELKKM